MPEAIPEISEFEKDLPSDLVLYSGLSAGEIDAVLNDLKVELKNAEKLHAYYRVRIDADEYYVPEDYDEICEKLNNLPDRISRLEEFLEIRRYYKVPRDGIKKRVLKVLEKDFTKEFGVKDIVQTLIDDGYFWDLVNELTKYLKPDVLTGLDQNSLVKITEVKDLANLISYLAALNNHLKWQKIKNIDSDPYLNNLIVRLDLYYGELDRYIRRVVRHFLKNFNKELINTARRKFDSYKKSGSINSDRDFFRINLKDKRTNIVLVYEYSIETCNESITYYIPQIGKTVNSDFELVG